MGKTLHTEYFSICKSTRCCYHQEYSQQRNSAIGRTNLIQRVAKREWWERDRRIGNLQVRERGTDVSLTGRQGGVAPRAGPAGVSDLAQRASAVAERLLQGRHFGRIRLLSARLSAARIYRPGHRRCRARTSAKNLMSSLRAVSAGRIAPSSLIFGSVSCFILLACWLINEMDSSRLSSK